MKKYLAPVAAAALLCLAGCSAGSPTEAMSPADRMSPTAMAPSDAMSPSGAMTPGDHMSPSDAMTGDAMAAPARFVTWEDYEASRSSFADSKVVLFFNAKWCPACKAIVGDLTADPNRIPEGTTVVSVDYDDHTDLRQQYKVTTQHTFVAVDDKQQEIRKWSSTSTDALLKELQG